MAHPVTQYLSRYAQPEASATQDLDGRWRSALVIPAYRESISLLDGIESAVAEAGALVVLVVNRRASDNAALAKNDELLAQVRAASPLVKLGDGVEWLTRNALDIVLIDRSTANAGFDERDGVGLARRIGLDFGLALWDQGKLTSRWLHTTDADVILPSGYFESADESSATAVALTYPYRHQVMSDPTDLSVALYECSLRYYVLGLRAAGSPYAYAAIGSTIAIDANAYAAVRGIPRRQAGEDFYLLEKLAKLGGIFRPRMKPILIRGNREKRTPFGTAASVADMLLDATPLTLYHPESFTALRSWLAVLEAIAKSGQSDLAEESIEDPLLGPCLRALGVRSGIERACSQAKDANQRRARLTGFFDAKLTLRLIHGLRDGGLPNLPWQRALAEASFISGAPGDEGDGFAWRARLEELENSGPQASGRFEER